jgi:hypothetical protein
VSYAIRIKEALDNADEWIDYLSRFSDSKLERRLDIVYQQLEIALANGQTDAVALLRIRREQIIEARLMKYDQHPPLDEMTETEKFIAEMEAMEKEIKKREKILAPRLPEPKPMPEQEDEQEDRPTIEVTQMKLF